MTCAVDTGALLDAARAARARAYAPYSGFTVGAALLTDAGRIVAGANFENASYGLSLCAEAVAIAAASAEGLLAGARTLAVVGDHALAPRGGVVVPCGRCRQMLAEAEHVAGRAIAVHCAPVTAAGDEGAVTYTLGQLLPHGFGPASL